MTVTILAMAAPAIRIIVRQRMGMATASEGMVGMTLPDIVHMVDVAVFPSPVPRLRALGRLLLVQARPLLAQVRPRTKQEGDTAHQEGRSWHPVASSSCRRGKIRPARLLLARAEAARNSGLWYTIRRG